MELFLQVHLFDILQKRDDSLIHVEGFQCSKSEEIRLIQEHDLHMIDSRHAGCPSPVEISVTTGFLDSPFFPVR